MTDILMSRLIVSSNSRKRFILIYGCNEDSDDIQVDIVVAILLSCSSNNPTCVSTCIFSYEKLCEVLPMSNEQYL